MLETANLWEEFGLDAVQEELTELFPNFELNSEALLERLMAGDVLGAMTGFVSGTIQEMSVQARGLRSILVWLLILGVASALMSHFVGIFDRNQVADLSFYLMYLLMTAILLKCFTQAAELARETMENIVLFVRLLVPTYITAVGFASGSVTMNASCQLLLLIICGVETLLLGTALPMIHSYLLLAVVNGIWTEEKLTLLTDLLEKGIGWLLKAVLAAVTGVSIFQAAITPVLDATGTGILQKMVSAIPGIGGAAGSVTGLIIGSALVIKNSLGVLFLILLAGLCAAPLLKLFLIGLLLKCAAALMGIVSDRRIVGCANRTGEAAMLLLRTTGTSMLLFLIVIAIVTLTTNVRM